MLARVGLPFSITITGKQCLRFRYLCGVKVFIAWCHSSVKDICFVDLLLVSYVSEKMTIVNACFVEFVPTFDTAIGLKSFPRPLLGWSVYPLIPTGVSENFSINSTPRLLAYKNHSFKFHLPTKTQCYVDSSTLPSFHCILLLSNSYHLNKLNKIENKKSKILFQKSVSDYFLLIVSGWQFIISINFRQACYFFECVYFQYHAKSIAYFYQ